jgi:hypothetical protein
MRGEVSKERDEGGELRKKEMGHGRVKFLEER